MKEETEKREREVETGRDKEANLWLIPKHPETGQKGKPHPQRTQAACANILFLILGEINKRAHAERGRTDTGVNALDSHMHLLLRPRTHVIFSEDQMRYRGEIAF